jgi:hypothetical protein
VQWCSGAVVQWSECDFPIRPGPPPESRVKWPGAGGQADQADQEGNQGWKREGKGRDRRFSMGVCVGFRFLQGSPPINNTPKNSPLIISLSLYSSLSIGEYNTRTLDPRGNAWICVYLIHTNMHIPRYTDIHTHIQTYWSPPLPALVQFPISSPLPHLPCIYSRAFHEGGEGERAASSPSSYRFTSPGGVVSSGDDERPPIGDGLPLILLLLPLLLHFMGI